MSKEKEIWREIEGYEGNYEVSSFGRVKKLAYSYVRNNRFRDYLMNADEHFVTHTIVKKGKHNVSLFKWVNGERKKLTTFVHIVVAKAFLEKPEGVRHQVRHKDKNADNNRASIKNKKKMKVKELIKELQEIENKEKYIHLLGNQTDGEDEGFDIMFNNLEVWDDGDESITIFLSMDGKTELKQ